MRFQVHAPVDWELVNGKPESDTKMLKRSLDRMKAGAAIKEVGGDRGFDSQANRDLLEASKVYNGICPKAPSELKKRMKQERFVKLQRRRSQTEGRIAVFKNGFLMRFQVLAPVDWELVNGKPEADTKCAFNVLRPDVEAQLGPGEGDGSGNGDQRGRRGPRFRQ